jgi:hypothetical protein
LTRYFAENRANVGLTAGMLLTSVKPRAARSFFTVSMNGPRPSTTWPLLMVMDPLPWPDKAFTTSAWALRFTRTHKFATCGLATILATWVWIKPSTAPASDPEKVCSRVPTRVRPLLFSAAAAWLVRACTSMRALISFVILSVSALWTAGS